MTRKVVSRVVEKLDMYPARLDCGENTVGHLRDEDFGDGVAELASVERVDDDAFLSWFCFESLWKKLLVIFPLKALAACIRHEIPL